MISRSKQTKSQTSKTMQKDKFCELENRIFLKGCNKLLHDFIMNTRGTISRICHIQSLISSWFRLWGIRKARMLENENYRYLGCQKLKRRTGERYRSACGAYHHHYLSKGVAEIVLVKQKQLSQITRVPWQKASLGRRIMPTMWRRERVRTWGTSTCKRTTHSLANKKERDKSKHQRLGGDIQSRDGRKAGMSGYGKKTSERGALTN
jgi:hypothetical protein